MGKHVIVIGGGVGGLSAAIRLGAAGHRVTLLEKNSQVGGKLNRRLISHPNRSSDRPFSFDTGPSLLTMPFVFEQLFAAANAKLSDYLDLRRLDPIARHTWADGTVFNLRAKQADLEQEISRIAPDDLTGFRQFAAEGCRIWDESAELFLFNSPDQLLSGTATIHRNPIDEGVSASAHPPITGLQKLRAAWSLLSTPFKIGMFRKYSTAVDRAVRSPKLREFLYQYATYSGASPFRAPATLAVIPHAEHAFGGWYPMGGMYRLAEALIALASKVGVRIRTDVNVERVMIEPTAKRGRRIGQVTGVRTTAGEDLLADAVICNADVVYVYRELIDSRFRKKFNNRTLDQIEPGGSGFVLLLGVEGNYPQLAHHTKFMPADYRSDLRAMFETRSIPVDPCIYVCATTRTDPSQAPDGCENLFVLASAPALDGRLDWASASRKYRDLLVRSLEEKWGLKDLARRIVAERTLSPLELKQLYNANAGSIYGIGSNNLRNAFLRPPNRDRDVSGLYFAGGATHPGGGLPLVALSGKICSELVEEDFG